MIQEAIPMIIKVLWRGVSFGLTVRFANWLLICPTSIGRLLNYAVNMPICFFTFTSSKASNCQFFCGIAFHFFYKSSRISSRFAYKNNDPPGLCPLDLSIDDSSFGGSGNFWPDAYYDQQPIASTVTSLLYEIQTLFINFHWQLFNLTRKQTLFVHLT